jgi:hypothetical protein
MSGIFTSRTVRNPEGVLDFCGQYFLVVSPKGCHRHLYRNGYNKDYQIAAKKGIAGLPQPTIPTEEQYARMKALDILSVPELKRHDARVVEEANARAAEEAARRAAAGEEEQEQEEDLEPWTKYTQKTGHNDKPAPRQKTKQT